MTTAHTYGAYGHRDRSVLHRGVAYAGYLAEEGADGDYLLDRRLYRSTLRRFVSPDPISPFGSGGMNRYVYCGSDPVNRVDPGGNMFSSLVKKFGFLSRATDEAAPLLGRTETPSLESIHRASIPELSGGAGASSAAPPRPPKPIPAPPLGHGAPPPLPPRGLPHTPPRPPKPSNATTARTKADDSPVGKRPPTWIIFQAPKDQGASLHFLTYENLATEHLEGVLAIARKKRRGVDDPLYVHFGRRDDAENPWDPGFWQDKPALQYGEYEQIEALILRSDAQAQLRHMEGIYRQQYEKMLREPGRHIHFYSRSEEIFRSFRFQAFPVPVQPGRRP